MSSNGEPTTLVASAASLQTQQNKPKIEIKGKENNPNDSSAKRNIDKVSDVSLPRFIEVPTNLKSGSDDSEDRTIDDAELLRQLTDKAIAPIDKLRDPYLEAVLRLKEHESKTKLQQVQEQAALRSANKKGELKSEEESTWLFPKRNSVKTMVDCPYDDCQMEFFFFSSVHVVSDLDKEFCVDEQEQMCKRCGRPIRLKTTIEPIIAQLDPKTDNKKRPRRTLPDPTK